MSVQFNAGEIFDIAEKIEINGAKFYRAAAKKFFSSPAAKVLNELASMEDEHRIIFAALKALVPTWEKSLPSFDPNNETRAYLEAIANGRVFDTETTPEDALEGQESVNDVLNYALNREKDSIIFYLGIREMVPEELGKNKIDRIIAEEKKHVVMITKMMK